jgi:hypothetical protein
MIASGQQSPRANVHKLNAVNVETLLLKMPEGLNIVDEIVRITLKDEVLAKVRIAFELLQKYKHPSVRISIAVPATVQIVVEGIIV